MHSIKNSALSRLSRLAWLSTVFSVASLHAGPGVQQWQAAGRKPALPTPIAPADAQICPGCSGLKPVDVTVMVPSWQNGRGPLVATTRKAHQICQTCAAPALGLKPAWRNGRGPLETAPAIVPVKSPVASSAPLRGE